jgi:hypothetical protein
MIGIASVVIIIKNYGVSVELCTINQLSGKWGNGEMGKWGNGEMGKWGNGEMGKFQLKPQNPKTPKP